MMEALERWRRSPARVCGAAALAWLLTGLYLVGPDQQAVVRLFGAAGQPVGPGLYWRPPWPLSLVDRVRTLETRQVSIGLAPAQKLTGQQSRGAEELVTGDHNLIELQATVQYSVKDARQFLFTAAPIDEMVAAVVHAYLTRAVAAEPVDSLMTTGKDAVRQLVLTDAQQALDHYGVGVQLRLLSLERIAPPQEVAAAFNDVQSARQDRDRLVNEATGYANELVPQARGQAAELLRQAEAYRTRLINEATGQAARFNKLAAAYRAAPAVTRVRMRLELLEKVAPNLRTTIVDSDQGRRPIDLGVIGLGAKPPASSGATP